MSGSASQVLNHEECLALLATSHLGQLMMIRHALPTAVPARYVLCEDTVLVHLSSTLDAACWAEGEVVGLHVYALDDDEAQGWTVSVVGIAHRTPNMRAVDEPPHAPWISEGGGDLIELSTEVIRGERIGVP